MLCIAGKSHSCSPIKRLKASDGSEKADQASNAAQLDSDDADSPTAAPITRHITRVRKAPMFYKPEVLLFSSLMMLHAAKIINEWKHACTIMCSV